jgi:hypothetical protein
VCEHLGGVYLAYAITQAGKNVGVVRVLNRKSDERILIKVFPASKTNVRFLLLVKVN